ncbi:RidA family protein [Sabulibacter ruber]|uniref:RidA family protein n=1 Tax=Sabulibacter ruber TaxID=2811901 RepID=UPI001A97848E|nr:RidA family protein [Sabulibacter ruber]
MQPEKAVPLENNLVDPKEILTSMGLKLPEASTPGGTYVSVNIRENIAYVAIQFPIRNGTYLFQGRLGENISTEQGYEAMQLCALNVLAQIDQKVGFRNLVGLNHLDAYFQSGEEWDDSPLVVNGASDLFVKVLGEKGTHSRAIFGVHKLPRNFCVGLTATFTIRQEQ